MSPSLSRSCIAESSDAAGTALDGLSAGALEAKDVLAGYHSSVDENRLVALIAAVDHRIEHLLANQAHLVVPLQA